MKIYHDRDISLIYNGVNRYWTYNGAWHKYDIYSVIKQFKHSNPSEFRKRFRYDALGKEISLCVIMVNARLLHQENSYSH